MNGGTPYQLTINSGALLFLRRRENSRHYHGDGRCLQEPITSPYLIRNELVDGGSSLSAERARNVTNREVVAWPP